jgi:CheY-like chemotaxis protein
MDIHLGPGENGMEATRKIRLIPAYERVPVIAVTGYTTSADKNRIFSSGCTHYLGKPFTKNQLLHIIQEAVPEPANNLS